MLALRNLLTDDKLELGPEMVEAGLPKVVQQRKTQVQFVRSLHPSGPIQRHGPLFLQIPHSNALSCSLCDIRCVVLATVCAVLFPTAAFMMVFWVFPACLNALFLTVLLHYIMHALLVCPLCLRQPSSL